MLCHTPEVSAVTAPPASHQGQGRWATAAAVAALVLALCAAVLTFGVNSLAHPVPACPSDRQVLIDRMVLATIVLAGASVIAGLAAVVGAVIYRRAALAVCGAFAILVACVVGSVVLQGYLCFNMTP